MKQTFLENNYFSTFTIKSIIAREIENKEEEAFENLKNLYNSLPKNILQSENEDDLRPKFISKVLKHLNYIYTNEFTFSYQGKNHRVDYVLFNETKDLEEFYDTKEEDRLQFLREKKAIFTEAKSYNQKLDTNKVDIKNNPHYQIINYLLYADVQYGFLTNGRYFRLYDKSFRFAKKVYLQIDLYDILENNNKEGFLLFYRLFNSSYYKKDIIGQDKKQNENKVKELEQSLESIIYGSEKEAFKDSIIEKIGSNIYQYYKRQEDNKDLKEVFHNSIILMFRLIFLFYYESKFRNLLQKHRAYKSYSIYEFYKKNIVENQDSNEDTNIYGYLISYFEKLSKGNKNEEIPMLNGGLFDETKASLLNEKGIFTNKEIKEIFNNMLLYKDVSNASLYSNELFENMQRDFSLIDIKKLGEIYENLLQYEFRVALKDTYIVSYKNKGEVITYSDELDLKQLKNKIKDIKDQGIYKEGEIYLIPLSNNRKQSASYYTPPSLTNFMVIDAIEEQLITYGKKPFDLKIIDNACGSGHFLVDALNSLSNQAINYPEIKDLIREEKAKIIENLNDIGIKEEKLIEELVDEGQILKRILLKKCIYGVDYNALAVEITKLALWMETFIFATPLSFIEHHIKCGNSLIGTSEAKYKQIEASAKQYDMFFEGEDKFIRLQDAYNKIVHITDTTASESEKSKEIYNQEILPIQKGLNEILNVLNYFHFIMANKKNIKQLHSLKLGYFALEKIEKKGMLKEVFKESFEAYLNAFAQEDEMLLKEVKIFKEIFSPFNYDIEFPDAFKRNPEAKVFSKPLFDIVIGNPPWEETAYNDNDFYSQYHSSYRTMSIAEKKALREKYEIEESYSYIAEHKVFQEAFITSYNNYLKARYPKNAGAGDNNLYKFFIEKNLALLVEETGSLSYLTPSIWSYAKGATEIRKHIFQSYQLKYFYQFENREKVFANVDSRYKFAIYKIGQETPDENKPIKFRFMQLKPSILKTEDNIMELSLKDIANVSSDYSILEINSKEELALINKCYRLFSKIDENYIKFTTEINITKDRNLIKEEKDKEDIEIYEGKYIHQFNIKFKDNQYFINEKIFNSLERSKEIYRIKKSFSKEELQNFEDETIEQAIDYNYNYYRLGFRRIARNTDERTLISAILPKNITHTNTILLSIPKKYIIKDNNIVATTSNSLQEIFFINALFNSVIIDYIIRKYVDTDVNNIYLRQIAIPQASKEEILANKDYKTLMENSILLHYMYAPEEFQEVVDKLNIDTSKVPKEFANFEKFKLTKQIENDLIVAKLYQITKKELELIINSFKVLNNKNPQYKELLLSKFQE